MADEIGAEFFVDEEDVLPAEPNLEIPANLNWIFSKNGQTFFHQVINTVGTPESETIESNAARIISSQSEQNTEQNEVVTDFLKQMAASFLVCYENVEQIKCPNKKMTNLERSITTLCDDSLINEKWSSLLGSYGLQTSNGTYILLHHVLQHFWSSLVLKAGSHELSERGEELNFSSSSSSTVTTEDIESESIKEHAGWVFKRVREEFNSGPEKYNIPTSKTDNTMVEVDKKTVLLLIQRLGHDVLKKPGKFLFTATPDVLEIFIYLHNAVERIVKDQLAIHVNKDILKKCLQLLSEDIQLRKMWCKVLGDEDDENFKSASVLLLQRVVTYFLKSKQQIIREQLQLKPSKQSSSLRQSLSNKKEPKERQPKERSLSNKKEPKQLSQNDAYVQAFRQNPTDISQVKTFLTNAFLIPSQAPTVLQKLHGQELTYILQSLGLPGLNGKKKKRQIEVLVKHNADGKQWDIIFPERVSQLICQNLHTILYLIYST